MVLRIEGQAFLDFTFFIVPRGVPTVVSDRALIRFFALFVRSSQLGASIDPRPGSRTGAEQLSVTVRVLMAHSSLLKTFTLPVEAV